MHPYVAHTGTDPCLLRVEPPYRGAFLFIVDHRVNPSLVIARIYFMDFTQGPGFDHFPHLPYHRVAGISVGNRKNGSGFPVCLLQDPGLLIGGGHGLFANHMEAVVQ